MFNKTDNLSSPYYMLMWHRLHLEQHQRQQHDKISAIKGLKVFIGDFDRANLIFEVIPKPSNFSQAIDDVCQHLPPPTIYTSKLSSITKGNTKITTNSNSTTVNEINSFCRDFSPTMQAGNAIVYCYSQKECVTVSDALTSRGNCVFLLELLACVREMLILRFIYRMLCVLSV